MIFVFILSLITAGVFVKLGALSVWVHVLTVTLNFALFLIVGFALALLSMVWKQNKVKM
jgi:hypothetical protein